MTPFRAVTCFQNLNHDIHLLNPDRNGGCFVELRYVGFGGGGGPYTLEWSASHDG